MRTSRTPQEAEDVVGWLEVEGAGATVDGAGVIVDGGTDGGAEL
jgi:hypothetical protein